MRALLYSENLAIPIATRCVSKWWRRVGDTLELTITLTDPKTYTKPWLSEKKVFRLQPKEEIREEICVPSIEEEFNRRTRNPAAGLPGR